MARTRRARTLKETWMPSVKPPQGDAPGVLGASAPQAAAFAAWITDTVNQALDVYGTPLADLVPLTFLRTPHAHVAELELPAFCLVAWWGEEMRIFDVDGESPDPGQSA
jgi:hypothetical protein